MAEYKRCALKRRKGEKEKEEKIKGKRKKKMGIKIVCFWGSFPPMVFRVYPSLRAVSISGVRHILIIYFSSSEQVHGS